MAESLFATLETELINAPAGAPGPTRDSRSWNYVEAVDNPERRHSALG